MHGDQLVRVDFLHSCHGLGDEFIGIGSHVPPADHGVHLLDPGGLLDLADGKDLLPCQTCFQPTAIKLPSRRRSLLPLSTLKSRAAQQTGVTTEMTVLLQCRLPTTSAPQAKTRSQRSVPKDGARAIQSSSAPARLQVAPGSRELRSGRRMFVLPPLRENKVLGCPIQRVLENDFVVVTGTAGDFIRLLTVELHGKQ
jgi:hypothetical protein